MIPYTMIKEVNPDRVKGSHRRDELPRVQPERLGGGCFRAHAQESLPRPGAHLENLSEGGSDLARGGRDLARAHAIPARHRRPRARCASTVMTVDDRAIRPS